MNRRLRFDEYPPIVGQSEESLISGYRKAKHPPRDMAPEPVQRVIYDISGLMYGEPLSHGRGARRRRSA